jgi:GNAT superfamily N-acetyltransferase
MITLGVASSERHFEQILDLQRRYHASALSPDAQEREGFVYAEHSAPLLRRMSLELPQAIAVADNDVVVGYCLSLSLSLQQEVPSLAPMFDQFGRCAYRGRPLSSFRFFVGGQVCVDRAYRGRGLLARLYEQVRRSTPTPYDLCVTEIAARNQVSVRAHERMGFEPIATYSDGREAWVIVAWDLSHPAVLAETENLEDRPR